MLPIFFDLYTSIIDLSHSTKISCCPARLGSILRNPLKIDQFSNKKESRNGKSAGQRLILFDLGGPTIDLSDSTIILSYLAGRGL